MPKLAMAIAAIALTATLSACDKAHAPASTENSAETGTNGTNVSEPADDAATTTGEMPATITATYDCKPAMAVSVVYDNGDAEDPKARVTIDGTSYDMRIARSASGARYVAEKGRAPGKTLIWWNKGNDGTLFEGKAGGSDTADETIIAACTGKS